MQMIVGGTPSTNTITTGSINSAVFRASTNVGEIAIFDENGVRLTEALAATASKFVIAVSRGADLPPLQTDVIVKSTVSNVKRLVYQPATEQSVAVGYNGTSGAINDIASYAGELYTDRIIFSMFMSGTDDERIKRGDFQSLLTSTQADVALGIVGSLIRNFNREVSNSAGDKPVVFKAVVNTPLANDFAFDNTGDATVTSGSKLISFAGAPTYNTGTSLAVGDFLRIGSATGTNAAVALLSDVYKVVAAQSATVFELDRVVSSVVVSGTYVDTAGNITVIPAAVGVAADWGYVKTGTVLDYRLGKSKYKKVRFESQLNDSFGSTPTTVLASPYEGSGAINKIRELENFLNGYQGEQYQMGQPFLFDSTDNVLASTAVAGGGYDIISFDHEHVLSGFTHTVSKKQVIIALPATTPEYALTGTSADDLTDVLEVLAGLGASDLLLT
jgi:hypothetical protein